MRDSSQQHVLYSVLRFWNGLETILTNYVSHFTYRWECRFEIHYKVHDFAIFLRVIRIL